MTLARIVGAAAPILAMAALIVAFALFACIAYQSRKNR